MNTPISRRNFVARTSQCALGASMGLGALGALGQAAGERPVREAGVEVLNPRNRVPVGIIIDDSTCLVNLNRFTMPQFDAAYGGANSEYHKSWKEWPAEIPDSFLRRFAEWAAAHGVKGKFSVVPFPACVGRLDRVLPGWTQRELADSLELVRTAIMPNWDVHPEMITHTRVIDLKTGHPYPEISLKFMENWEWTKGKSVDELAGYVAYALEILRNAGLKCEGVTSPGGFGNGALPELSQAVFQAVRSVFNVEIPHYFRDLHDSGTDSVAPRVEYASGLTGQDPRCVVSVLACTGDWTGGWDCATPEGADRFITPDLAAGRMVEVIERGEPAMMLAHWTGVYWNGKELGFNIFQEVVRRVQARFNNLIWMKLSELSRYWAAKTLTQISRRGENYVFNAPFAAPDFTVKYTSRTMSAPRLITRGQSMPLTEVSDSLKLTSGTWTRQGEAVIICFDLQKGPNELASSAS